MMVDQFFQTGFIHKAFDTTGTENFNGFSTKTNIESPLGTYDNGSEDNRGWNN